MDLSKPKREASKNGNQLLEKHYAMRISTNQKTE